MIRKTVSGILIILVSTATLALALRSVAASAETTLIDEMISQISESEIYDTVYCLQNFTTRVYGYPGNLNAGTYLYNRLSDISGLDVEYQGDFRNVIATLPGVDETSDAFFIVGAHYDSKSSDPDNAPGATDNGGGVAIVLEFARVMSQYRFNHTVIFAFWNAEEIGVEGSANYVRQAIDNSPNMSLYLNYDSACYDPDNRMILDIIYNDDSKWVSDLYTTHNSLYSINFALTYNLHQGCGSDHKPFWWYGFTAVTTHSETHGPAHTIYDTVDKVSTIYAKKNGQLGMSVLATLAEIIGPVVSIVDYAPTGTVVPIATKITVTFSESMNQTSVEEAFSTSPIVSGSFTWGGNTVSFTPDTLRYATTYNVTISTEAKDVVGNSLQSPLSWQFTTSPRPYIPRPPPPPAPEVDVDLSSVSQDRCDVGCTQNISFHVVMDGRNVVNGTVYVNGTGYVTNATGWISFANSSSTVDKKTWVVTDVSYEGLTEFEQTASNPSIIWDRIRVDDGGVTNTLTNTAARETVWYRAIYEYDGTPFEAANGALHLNGSAMAWSPLNNRWEANYTFDTPGTRTFRISSVLDSQYGLTAINDAVGSFSMAWIELEVTPDGVVYNVPVTSEGVTYNVPVATNSTISSFTVDPTS